VLGARRARIDGPSPRGDAVDEQLGAEEHRRPGEEPECDPAVSRRGLERLVHELVGDRADQDARAEGHDQAHVAAGDGRPQRDDAAEDERGASDDAPEESLAHQRGRIGAEART
jgi:hypothetical protein